MKFGHFVSCIQGTCLKGQKMKFQNITAERIRTREDHAILNITNSLKTQSSDNSS